MKEFSVELNDEPGQLATVCEAIALKGANILAGAGIGKARPAIALVTDDEEATSAALDDLGVSYDVNELHITTLPNRPGGLAEFSRVLGDAGVNLRSLFIMQMEVDSADIAFTVDNDEKALEALGL
tara:strand:- start:489 stop:866 length:378 start_codon:yes stop_codon:yes gene_type:complete